MSRVLLNIALIDDEPSARNIARELLTGNFPEVRIVGEAGSVREGQILLERAKPDLVLLDIDLPDGTGFELLGQWKEPPFKVIFITAYDQFAVRAFQFAAFDYLLKPFDPVALTHDVQKLLHSGSPPTPPQLDALYTSIATQKPDRLLIPYQTGFHVILLEELLCIQSEGSYSYLYSKNQPRILSSCPIAQYEDMLPAGIFQRVHQSYILNLLEVRAFSQSDDMEATLANGQKIPVSRRKKQAFLEVMRRLSLE